VLLTVNNNLRYNLRQVTKRGKGHYYKNQNIKKQKEHQKICKPSLHGKSPLKRSLRQKSLCQKHDKLPMA
jgi:hypothetical protein